MMKKDSKTVRMIIHIGGEVLPLTVPFDRQDLVRDTEACVADLYDLWRQRFPKKSDRELLAMVTYQFASYYLELADYTRRARTEAEEACTRLDTMTDKMRDTI